MQVGKGKDVNPVPRQGEIFMGQVYGHSYITDEAGHALHMNLVKFSPNARTKWHTHPFEQGLIIVEGKGIVATEEQEHLVEPGDVVHIPTGEKHWHGATETTGMAHIAINGTGEATVLEPVIEVKTKV